MKTLEEVLLIKHTAEILIQHDVLWSSLLHIIPSIIIQRGVLRARDSQIEIKKVTCLHTFYVPLSTNRSAVAVTRHTRIVKPN